MRAKDISLITARSVMEMMVRTPACHLRSRCLLRLLTSNQTTCRDIPMVSCTGSFRMASILPACPRGKAFWRMMRCGRSRVTSAICRQRAASEFLRSSKKNRKSMSKCTQPANRIMSTLLRERMLMLTKNRAPTKGYATSIIPTLELCSFLAAGPAFESDWMSDFAAVPASDFELPSSFVAGMKAEHLKPDPEPELQALCPERDAGLVPWALPALLPVLLPLASCNEQWLRQNSARAAESA